MNVLSKNSLPLGGFAGLREYRVVADSKVFGLNKPKGTSEGIGNFVYLADGSFIPYGETGLHPHKELDIVTIVIDGQLSHEGTLEDGSTLKKDTVQVQRAGGEGFSHNEINPDGTKNRITQLWILPEQAGRSADYKYYSVGSNGRHQVYGGSREQTNTLDSATIIEVIKLEANESISFAGEALIYLTEGQAELQETSEPGGQEHTKTVEDGDLIRGINVEAKALSKSTMIVISKTQ